MTLYTLMPDEIEAINQLNQQRVNSLLIVGQFGNYSGVNPDDLQKPEYAQYLCFLAIMMQLV